MKLKARIKNFDPVTFDITFSLIDMDDNTYGNILDSMESVSNQFGGLTLDVRGARLRKDLSDTARKKWFAALSHLLVSENIHPDKFTLKALSDDFKRVYLSANMMLLDGKEIPVVPSINDYSSQEVHESVELMKEDYPRVFENWNLEE